MSRSSLEKTRSLLVAYFYYTRPSSLVIVHYPCTVYAFRSLRMLTTPMQLYFGTAVWLYLLPNLIARGREAMGKKKRLKWLGVFIAVRRSIDAGLPSSAST